MSQDSKIEPGDFPFRLLEGKRESKYLTWVRNHSSFLQLSGIAGAMQALATYVRGVIGNLLILTPWLFLLGTLLGAYHFVMLEYPFWLTKWTIAFSMIFVLGFFAFRSADTRYSQPQTVAGKLAFLLLFVVILEASPHVIEYVRRFEVLKHYGVKEVASLIVGFASSAGVIARFVPASAGIRRNILLGVLAILAFGITWMVLLGIANFVAYGLPPHDWQVITPLLMVLAICFCAFLYAFRSPVFKFQSRLISLCVLLVAFTACFYFRGDVFSNNIMHYSESASTHIGTITRPLRRIVDGISDSVKLEQLPKNSEERRAGGLIVVNFADNENEESNLDLLAERIQLKNLAGRIELLDRQGKIVGNGHSTTNFLESFAAPDWVSREKYEPSYFRRAATFLEKAEVLAELNEVEQSIILDGLTRVAKERLFELVVEKKAAEATKKLADAKRTAKAKQKTAPPSANSVTGKSGSAIDQAQEPNENRNRTSSKISAETKSRSADRSVASNTEGSPRTVTANSGEAASNVAKQRQHKFEILSKYSPDSLTFFASSLMYNLEIKEKAAEARLGEKPKDDSATAVTLRVQRIARLLATMNYVKRHMSNNVLQFKHDMHPVKFERDMEKLLSQSNLELIFNDKDKAKFVGKAQENDDYTWIRDYRSQIFMFALRSALPGDEAKNYITNIDLSDTDWFAEKWLTRTQFLTDFDVDEMSTEDLLQAAFKGKGIVSIKSKVVERTLGLKFEPIPSVLYNNDKFLAAGARLRLVELAVNGNGEEQRKAIYALGELFQPETPHYSSIYGSTLDEQQKIARKLYDSKPVTNPFAPNELELLLARTLLPQEKDNAERLIRRMVFGRYGNLENVGHLSNDLYGYAAWSKFAFLVPVIVLSLVLSYLFIDVNATSLHSFYRDRLAYAFMPSEDLDTKIVFPDTKVLLQELSDYDNGNSYAPYHLINAAINMQRSGEEEIRNRNADFFIFSKRFVGGNYTGYVSTEDFHELAPELNVASAMAISGAAASSAMGKYSNGILAFFLSILNIRLGYWIPHPRKVTKAIDFEDVFKVELEELKKRRNRLGLVKHARGELTGSEKSTRSFAEQTTPTVDHQLFGIALSGGGIRSASINMGILQVLERYGLFEEIDYLSTVSGGGYLGAGVSTFMRRRELLKDEPPTESAGEEGEDDVAPPIRANTRLGEILSQLQSRFRWMPKSWLFFFEMFSYANHRLDWVNVSDGGHIENLGVYELLRRQCKLIIIGDGECDPDRVYDGLSHLARIAQIDLGVQIEYDELVFSSDEEVTSSGNRNFAFGTITYPAIGKQKSETGYVIYLKSGMPEKVDLILKNYQRVNPAFPHESTLDQNFSESQFEAYRRVGYFNALEVLKSFKKIPNTFDGLVSCVGKKVDPQTKPEKNSNS